MNNFGLTQRVKEPTRINVSTQALIGPHHYKST